MMPLAIDPSEMRAPARLAKAAARQRSARPILLAALGCVGLVGLSAGSYALLSGLAGPQTTRIKVGRMAADMPDLRDGVPALVPSITTVRSPVPATPVPVAPVAVAATVRALEVPPRAVDVPLTTLAAKPDAPAKPARVLPMENATLVAPSRAAALIPVMRTAALVAPSAGETTRSRVSTSETSFAALPPEPATAEAPAPRKKPVPVVTRAKTPVAKPASTTRVATAPDSPPSAAAEAEETEVFGMKVPSLAPAGRKFVEGVQALGDAVKSWPDRF